MERHRLRSRQRYNKYRHMCEEISEAQYAARNLKIGHNCLQIFPTRSSLASTLGSNSTISLLNSLLIGSLPFAPISTRTSSHSTIQDPLFSSDWFTFVDSRVLFPFSIDHFTSIKHLQNHLILRPVEVNQTEPRRILLCARRIDNTMKLRTQQKSATKSSFPQTRTQTIEMGRNSHYSSKSPPRT